jgi:Arc/MetJ-type ribon-helix-helix transcriptional regulator
MDIEIRGIKLFLPCIHVATQGEKVNVLFPSKAFEEMTEIVETKGKWISVQEFIREAVSEKIDRIKKENPRLFER